MAVLQTAVMYTLQQTCCQWFKNHFVCSNKNVLFYDDILGFCRSCLLHIRFMPFLWDKCNHCMRRPKPGAANALPELGRLYKILIKMSPNIPKTRNELVHSIKIQ